MLAYTLTYSTSIALGSINHMFRLIVYSYQVQGGENKLVISVLC